MTLIGLRIPTGVRDQIQEYKSIKKIGVYKMTTGVHDSGLKLFLNKIGVAMNPSSLKTQKCLGIYLTKDVANSIINSYEYCPN